MNLEKIWIQLFSSEAKLDKRALTKSAFFAPQQQQQQNTIVEAEIVTEEDKKYIMIYFKHKTVSLIKIIEEKLKKFTVWPKYRKKTGKVILPDVRDVADVTKNRKCIF